MKPDFTLAYVPVNKDMRVDAAVGCGKRFEGVAWILEYTSQNPSLKIEKGLGLGAVKKILARVEDGFVE